MNTVDEGRHYKKHIIVRRVPRRGGHLLQLYTYHFPKAWSAACIENRELIKTAQKLAHSLEHDHSLAAMEWRIRFFRHYFRVVKGGAKPEPGLKPYTRFYQYTYVSIYRDLQSAWLTASVADRTRQKALESETSEDAISFNPVAPMEPIIRRPHIITAIQLDPFMNKPDVLRVGAIDPPPFKPLPLRDD